MVNDWTLVRDEEQSNLGVQKHVSQVNKVMKLSCTFVFMRWGTKYKTA